MDSGKHQHVFTDPTSKLHSAGDMVAIMEVLVRPPSESCNILVNLLSLLVQEGSNHQKITRSAYKGHLSAPSNEMVQSFQSEEETTITPPKGKKNEFGNQRGKQVFSIIFKSVQACWTDAAIQYMHIFFARSISLWTGSLNKDEVAKITAVIFFVFVGQTEARAGQAFRSSSLANDLHFALASIPLRETYKKNSACFAS